MIQRRAPGGRRHGLVDSGPAPRIKVSLSDEDRARLAELADRWECSQAEAIRWAVWLAAQGHDDKPAG